MKPTASTRSLVRLGNTTGTECLSYILCHNKERKRRVYEVEEEQGWSRQPRVRTLRLVVVGCLSVSLSLWASVLGSMQCRTLRNCRFDTNIRLDTEDSGESIIQLAVVN